MICNVTHVVTGVLVRGVEVVVGVVEVEEVVPELVVEPDVVLREVVEPDDVVDEAFKHEVSAVGRGQIKNGCV
jgi:hypothetical protein